MSLVNQGQVKVKVKVKGQGQVLRVTDVTACRAYLSHWSHTASCQVGQRHTHAIVFSGRLNAGAHQHRSAALSGHVVVVVVVVVVVSGARSAAFSGHVYLRHLRHVILHARQTHQRHRRSVQLRDVLPEHDLTVPDLDVSRLGRRVGRTDERRD